MRWPLVNCARFVVPYRMGWGCSPLTPGCRDRSYQSFYFPFGEEAISKPFSQLVVRGWFNGPKVRFAFTIKRGRKVLKRLHTTRSSDGNDAFEVDFRLFRLRGVVAGTRLSCLIGMSGGRLTIRRTVSIRAGAGRSGVVFG